VEDVRHRLDLEGSHPLHYFIPPHNWYIIKNPGTEVNRLPDGQAEQLQEDITQVCQCGRSKNMTHSQACMQQGCAFVTSRLALRRPPGAAL
jgi:hypothetical protein